jgi:hypothetical protein
MTKLIKIVDEIDVNPILESFYNDLTNNSENCDEKSTMER